MKVAVLLLLLSVLAVAYSASITLDGGTLGRRFDGIGGLSGGGATSRFLPSYKEPYISQIFDYLFLPNFGAALHICKVEIGGDAQTTEGTESSHMHSKTDLNYNRGYEWWIMTEAKKRNPDVLLYGLSWGVPGWIGGGSFFSQDNIDYHINWVKGAKSVYNLDIDYIGVWNERSWNADWIIRFRSQLDAAGFTKTKIVAADAGWDIADTLLKNATLKNAVGVVGAHYPGTTSTANAVTTGTPLWSSEDYSTYADSTGGGCWGRILNQNYVNGHMTSTISWNLIAAYYDNLPYGGDGLMWANNPWSGHYDVQSPIWVSAHTTQFAKPGWSYLAHGSGVGKLPSGGSYVTLVPPSNKAGDFSLVVETFTHDHSICIRPGLPAYTVSPQNVTFQLTGGLASNKPLSVWKTHLAGATGSTYFEQLTSVTPQNGAFTLDLDLDSIITVTTTTGQKKGQYPAPPPSQRFPASYSDDFEKYPVDSEADYFADQTGVFEIYTSKTKVMRQVAPAPPIQWCGESASPISLIGDYNTGDQVISVDALIETTGSAIIGLRVQQGGCGDSYKSGYFLNIAVSGSWTLFAGTTVLDKGTTTFSANTWHTLKLTANATVICAFVSGTQVSCKKDATFKSGFVSIGSTWNHVQFDNFMVQAEHFTCGVGDYIKIDLCDATKTNQQWVVYANDSTIRSKSDLKTCLTVSGVDPKSGSPSTRLLPCNQSPQQQWKISGTQIVATANGACLDITGQATAQCSSVEVFNCNSGNNQAWQYSSASGLIQTVSAMGLCLAATT